MNDPRKCAECGEEFEPDADDIDICDLCWDELNTEYDEGEFAC